MRIRRAMRLSRLLASRWATRTMPRTAKSGRKSICIITEADGFGGAEVHTLALMKRLAADDFSISLVCCRHRYYDQGIAANGLKDRVNTIYCDVATNDESEYAMQEWRRVLDQIGCDVLILVKGGVDTGNLGFLLLCRRSFRKLIFVEQLEAPPPPQGSLSYSKALRHKLNVARRRLRASNADNVIAVSDKVRDRLVNDWGYRDNKVVVVKNGIPWRHFVRSEQRGSAFRYQHQIPADTFVFGMMTRLVPVKGVDIALRSLHQLISRGVSREVRLVIAGDGPDRESLERLTKTLALEKYVIFIGHVSDPADVLSAYDSILLPSRTEGMPLTLLEAMAAGCIPIVSSVGGMPEAVSSKDVGWIIPPEDPHELCRVLREILDLEASELSSMRQKANAIVRKDFDIDEGYRKILEVCELNSLQSSAPKADSELRPICN